MVESGLGRRGALVSGNLLLDRYPPFAFDREYPVNVDIQPGPVRRLAVLFRIFLLIPANIVSSLASAFSRCGAGTASCGVPSKP